MRTMKNNYSIEERNHIVEEHLWCIEAVVRHNRKAIRAAGLDEDDASQDLSLRLIHAVGRYEQEEGDLCSYLFMELQDEMIQSLSRERAKGLAGIGSAWKQIAIQSLDSICDREYRAAA